MRPTMNDPTFAPPVPPPPPPPAAFAPPAPTASPVDGTTKAIAFALFGAALLVLVGTVTKSWFTAPHGIGVGLTGAEACVRDQCMSIGWSEMKQIPSDVVIFAYLGLLGGLAAAGAAATMGGLLLAGKARKIPVKPINLVLGVAAFSTTMFLMRLYSDDPKHVSFGFSGFVAIGGIIAIGALTKQGVMPRAKA